MAWKEQLPYTSCGLRRSMRLENTSSRSIPSTRPFTCHEKERSSVGEEKALIYHSSGVFYILDLLCILLPVTNCFLVPLLSDIQDSAPPTFRFPRTVMGALKTADSSMGLLLLRVTRSLTGTPSIESGNESQGETKNFTLVLIY